MQPDRECARIALDQVAEQSLHRPGGAAVHHHRPLARAVLGDVFQIEALRQLEVDLDCRVGELAVMGVADLKVDLRPVERSLARTNLVLLAHRFQRLGEVGLRHLPPLLCPEPLLLHVVARGELVPELVDAKHL